MVLPGRGWVTQGSGELDAVAVVANCDFMTQPGAGGPILPALFLDP